MAGEINRVPVGLLSLLDMKARGQSPRILSGSVDASLELLDFYLQNGRQIFSGNASSGAAPFNVTIGTVPQNELWYIHGISILSGTLTAALGVVPTVLRTNTQGSVVTHSLGEPHAYLTGDQVRSGWSGPFILQPGDQPGCSFWRSTAIHGCVLALDRTIITT